jgi:hypothetical protein
MAGLRLGKKRGKSWRERAAAASLGFGRTPSFFFYKYPFLFFCRVSGNGLLLGFPPLPLLHALRSIFIVQESHRLREIKSQSNSISFLKFELESNSKANNYHYKRQGHLSSLWQGKILVKELQGISCKCEGKEA